MPFIERKTMNKLVCRLRHEHTRYNQLALFYECQKQYRNRLNHICMMFVLQYLTQDEFDQEVRKLEMEVDLTLPKNQKKFIKNALNKNPALCEDEKGRAHVKQAAEDDLRRYIHYYQQHNKKVKMYLIRATKQPERADS